MLPLQFLTESAAFPRFDKSRQCWICRGCLRKQDVRSAGLVPLRNAVHVTMCLLSGVGFLRAFSTS